MTAIVDDGTVGALMSFITRGRAAQRAVNGEVLKANIHLAFCAGWRRFWAHGLFWRQ